MTRNRQRGAFMMARALLVVGILVAMLVIPVYLKKERENREAEVHRKELEMSRGPTAACVRCIARPIRWAESHRAWPELRVDGRSAAGGSRTRAPGLPG